MIPLLLIGCTFQAGEGFGELAPGALEVALVPGEARDLGDHTILTDEGYAVALSALELDLGDAALQELRGGAGVEFDPADPPEGYTLCHGGHCHSESGALVAYEDIIAELSGGQATYVAVATAPVAGAVDLLAGVDLPLEWREAWLPMATLGRFLVPVTALRGEATVTGGPLPDGEALSMHLDLALDDGFSTATDIPVDRDHPPRITVDAAIEPDGAVLDGLDLAALAEDGVLDLLDPSHPAAAQLVEALVTTLPQLTVRRSD